MFKKISFWLAFVSMVVVLAGSAWANADPAISFQGRLTDTQGNPITAAGTAVIFRIFNVETGGGSLWQSTLTVDPDDNGFFSVVLEGGSPDLSTLDFNEQYWLGVEVNGNTLSPRQRLTAAPYAVALTSGSKTIEGTLFVNTVDGSAIRAYSENDWGVYGRSSANYGVYGYSIDKTGVYGYSHNRIAVQGNGSSYGVFGTGRNSDGIGVYGISASGVGVKGYTTDGLAGEFTGDVKVEGLVSAESDDSNAVSGKASGSYHAGVRGESTRNVGGYGIYGKAPRPEDWMGNTFYWGAPQSWAGYFNGDVKIDGDLCITGIITCEGWSLIIDKIWKTDTVFGESILDLKNQIETIGERTLPESPYSTEKVFNWREFDKELQLPWPIPPDPPDPCVLKLDFYYLKNERVIDGVKYLPGLYFFDEVQEQWFSLGQLHVSQISGAGALATMDSLDASLLRGTIDKSILVTSDIATQTWTSEKFESKSLSSIKHKKNIQLLSDDFYRILKLQPKSFVFKDSGREDIGYIAEEVEEAGLKNLVVYKDGQPDGLKYDKIPIYILEVVKKQQKEIEALRAEVEALKAVK